MIQNDRNNKIEKFGLGLFISKQIIHANSGHIDLVSDS